MTAPILLFSRTLKKRESYADPIVVSPRPFSSSNMVRVRRPAGVRRFANRLRKLEECGGPVARTAGGRPARPVHGSTGPDGAPQGGAGGEPDLANRRPHYRDGGLGCRPHHASRHSGKRTDHAHPGGYRRQSEGGRSSALCLQPRCGERRVHLSEGA